MGKQNGGIYFERKVYRSDAYKSLGKNARQFVLALLDARQVNPSYKKMVKKGVRADRYTNTNRIEMPYTTLTKVWGIPGSSIPKALDDAMARGFVDIAKHGGNGEHDKALYALKEDYINWEPDQVIFKRQNDVKRGFQGKLLGAAANRTGTQN